MATTIKALMPRLGGHCRTSAVALIAGVCRWRSIGEINDRIKAQPVRDQALITGSVLLIVFALCLFSAQFGLIGILLFWLAILLLVN